MDNFIANPEYLSKAIEFDQPRLGDIAGLDCIHLQCHLGTDSLSLARLGAKSVTGLDFSSESIAQGQSLAAKTQASGGERVHFVKSDLYAALEVVESGSYDLVFTGIGALCWLPRIHEWAQIVSALLRPGGRLFLREAHPILWTLDENGDDLVLKHSYFEHSEPKVCSHETSYVETQELSFQTKSTGEFNHGLGEIIQSLIDAGMQITQLVEHDSLPWAHIPGLMTKDHRDEWKVNDRPKRLPHSYTLQAIKVI